MAKKAKVPLNVLVVEGTRAAIRELAETLECSQGEVVDRAVVLLGANGGVARGLAGASLPAPPPVDYEAAPALVDNRPKSAFCKHCGDRFAGSKLATICAGCKSSGHTLEPAECPVCNEGRGI